MLPLPPLNGDTFCLRKSRIIEFDITHSRPFKLSTTDGVPDSRFIYRLGLFNGHQHHLGIGIDQSYTDGELIKFRNDEIRLFEALLNKKDGDHSTVLKINHIADHLLQVHDEKFIP